MFLTFSKALFSLSVLALTLRCATAAPVPMCENSLLEKPHLMKRHLMMGDGTVAKGWPDQSKWMSFEAMWNTNKAEIDRTDNQPDETQDLHEAILGVAQETNVDARFILATVMQESTGRVRVGETAVANSNPGLMQAYGPLAKGSCQAVPTNQRCTTDQIWQMIRDGTSANAASMGLQDLIAKSGRQDVSKFYIASKMYNSGPNSIPASGELSGPTTGTLEYASDVAHRLTGEA